MGINVKVSGGNTQKIASSTIFVGATNVQNEVNTALNTANTALAIAYELSNNKNKLINASNAEVILEANNNLTVPGSIVLPSNGALNFAGETVTVLTANAYNDVTGLYLEDRGVAALYANSYIVIQPGENNPNGTPTWLFNTDGSLTFPDNTLQTTAFSNAYISKINTTSNVAQQAYNQANLAYNQANVAFSAANAAISNTAGSANAAFYTANLAYAKANSAGAFANSAFVVANNALANTTGTFGGNLTISGNTTVFGTIFGNVAIIDAGTF